MVITESSLPKPVDPYQCSKLRAEKIVQTYHKQHGMDTIILRLGALYGLHGRYALNRLFFEEFLRGWRVKLDGGKYITFPCFVKDAAHGIESAMRLGKSGEMYNISGESVSHNEFNLLVSRLSNKSTWRLNFPKIIMLNFARFLEGLATITQREPFYPINLQYYVFHNWMVDSQKARDTLGFQSTPLEEGVMQTLAWYKSELGLY
ncbi:MAG: hypothetical protein B6242_03900 [Anaerolineaceae bacterium 4572_78]|nr:MAG: hypothetical protein B6242_03900 [Anaerolineaceae bacterium 4572_78]